MASQVVKRDSHISDSGGVAALILILRMINGADGNRQHGRKGKGKVTKLHLPAAAMEDYALYILLHQTLGQIISSMCM